MPREVRSEAPQQVGRAKAIWHGGSEQTYGVGVLIKCTEWKPVTSERDLVSRAIYIAEKVADRILYNIHSFQSPGLADGLSGVAVFLRYLARVSCDEPWEREACHVLKRAFALAHQQKEIGAGLFDGLAGLAWTASYVTDYSPRNKSIVDAINDKLAHGILSSPTVYEFRDGYPEEYFDIVYGLSGTGLHLIDYVEDSTCRRAIAAIAEVMKWLSGSGVREPCHIVTGNVLLVPSQTKKYPQGWWDFGLAHGHLGPLAFLSKCILTGVADSQCVPAVEALCKWMRLYQQSDEHGVNWPFHSGLEGGPGKSDELARSAWCYGNPGISRAFWLAGNALNDQKLMRMAIDTMMVVCNKPQNEWGADNPSICHGLAGILLVCLRFYNDTGREVFRDQAVSLLRELMDQCDFRLRYGFLDEEASNEDAASLLTGSIGVCLALLAAVSNVSPDWDRVLAIS